MDTVPAYADWRAGRQLRWAGLADYMVRQKRPAQAKVSHRALYAIVTFLF